MSSGDLRLETFEFFVSLFGQSISVLSDDGNSRVVESLGAGSHVSGC